MTVTVKKAFSWRLLAACNLAGILLFASWLLPEEHGFWQAADVGVFRFFNDLLPQSRAFMYFVALVNLRIFDAVPFCFMLAILYGHYRKKTPEGKRRLFCVGMLMLLTAVAAKYVDAHWINIARLSPSRFFADANLVSELSGWPAKDMAGDSFPGDHGMMLLIFSFYMLRYCGRRAFGRCLAVVAVFSLPRLMSGAHWLTDIAVGSLSIVLVLCGWLLYTPLADSLLELLAARLPLKYFK